MSWRKRKREDVRLICLNRAHGVDLGNTPERQAPLVRGHLHSMFFEIQTCFPDLLELVFKLLRNQFKVIAVSVEAIEFNKDHRPCQ